MMRCACFHVDGTILITLSEINPRTTGTYKTIHTARTLHRRAFESSNLQSLIFFLSFAAKPSLCMSLSHSRSLSRAVYRLSTFTLCDWVYQRCTEVPPGGRSSRMRFTCSYVDGLVSELSFGTGTPNHCNVKKFQDDSYPAGDSN